jgi:glutamine cyclotransferase
LSYGTDGTIYETTGLYSNSKLRKINPSTFDVEQSVNLERKYFGEGSTFFTDKDGNGRIIEITWKEQTGFIYNADTLETLSTFQYTTTAPNHEGWGITYNPHEHEFIVSDGSSYLYFWDRDTLEEKRKVGVTRFDGSMQNELNELEFMDGLVCCNIWHEDDIICVDPTTGKSAREYGTSLFSRQNIKLDLLICSFAHSPSSQTCPSSGPAARGARVKMY